MLKRFWGSLLALALLLAPVSGWTATNGQWIDFGPFFSGGTLQGSVKVYHYSAGTLTLKDCYSDRAKLSTVAQPFVLDAQGYGSMFCDGLYKFVIKDSADTTLYTLDNVAVSDTTLTTVGEGSAITSASTLTLPGDGDFHHVAGSTGPITAISGSQYRVTLAFDSTPTLTHSGSLILKHAADYTVAAGDVLQFQNEGSSVWREVGRLNIPLASFPQTLGGVGTTPRVSSSSAVAYGAPSGYLFGLTLSNNGSDATNDIDIAVGEASSVSTTHTSRVVMALTSALTKRLDATWVTGTNQGGRSSSLSLADDTWHVCLIRVAGVDDVGFDTSPTCANLVTDHSATHTRRIGSIVRASSAILGFTQRGDQFLLTTGVLDYASTAVSSTSALVTLASMPTDIKLIAHIRWSFDGAAVNSAIYISSPDVTDQNPSDTVAPLQNVVNSSTIRMAGELFVRTNTSAQFRIDSTDSSGDLDVVTVGWIDERGRLF